jgi:dihydrofolate synthase/folylpolyglutamate synthase
MHQTRNAAVALAALEVAHGIFAVSEAAVRNGLQSVTWPGRFEIMLQKPTVILDGAHNGEGVKALLDELECYRAGRRVRLLFAAMEDKDWRLMLNTLSGVADEVVLTRVAMDRSADPRQLAAHLAHRVPHTVIEDSRCALGGLVDHAQPDDIIVVAGSLYLLGELRPQVQAMAAARPAGIKNPTYGP